MTSKVVEREDVLGQLTKAVKRGWPTVLITPDNTSGFCSYWSIMVK